MIITVASFKGGVAKTTTAVHLAAYLQRLAPTLLLDGDPNRQALVWNTAGRMPFKVADILQSAKHAADYGVGRGHIVIDTEARPGPRQRPTGTAFSGAVRRLHQHCSPRVPATTAPVPRRETTCSISAITASFCLPSSSTGIGCFAQEIIYIISHLRKCRITQLCNPEILLSSEPRDYHRRQL